MITFFSLFHSISDTLFTNLTAESKQVQILRIVALLDQLANRHSNTLHDLAPLPCGRGLTVHRCQYSVYRTVRDRSQLDGMKVFLFLPSNFDINGVSLQSISSSEREVRPPVKTNSMPDEYDNGDI